MNAPQAHTNGPSVAAATAAAASRQSEGAALLDEILDRTSDRYRLGLEPRDLDRAWEIAEAAAEAKLAPTEAEAYARILIGRPLGIPAMASIQGIALVEQKSTGMRVPCMFAKLKLALLQSRRDIVEYIRPLELTNERATWVAKRVGDPEPVKYTFTMEDARIAGLVGRGDGKTNSAGVQMSNYDRHPGPMVQWRACGRLCDIIAADVLTGIATREDVEDENRIAREELQEVAATAARGELRQALDAPPQAKAPTAANARDFRAEADALKKRLLEAIATRKKPAMQEFRAAYDAFKKDAPAELSEEIQAFYSEEVGKARRAENPGGASTAAPPVPTAAPKPAPAPPASAQNDQPPPDAGDAWEPPR